MYTTQFNIHKLYVLPTQCIYVFCMDLRTNSYYFSTQNQLIYSNAPSQNLGKRLLVSSCPSVRPHGTIRLPLDGFSLNYIFDDFTKLSIGSSNFFIISQEQRLLYVKASILFS
jgi:hypothetical protein